MIPARWCNQLPYHERRYDPIWALCEEYDMPIVTHSGSAPREEYGDLLGIYVTEVTWWPARPMWFMLWSGVPGLLTGCLLIALPLLLAWNRRRGHHGLYAATVLCVPLVLHGLTDTVLDDLRIVSYHLMMTVMLMTMVLLLISALGISSFGTGTREKITLSMNTLLLVGHCVSWSWSEKMLQPD
jgi:hypothetical protein